MKSLRSFWRSFRYVLLRTMAARGKRNRLVLGLGILFIVVWQWGFSFHDAKIDATYQNTASSGIHNEAFFVYFFWYKGLFPVASTQAYQPCGYKCPPLQESMAPAPLTDEAATQVLKTRGSSLMMDASWTWNAGDRGKIFLYFFDAWLKGAPWKPQVRPFHRLVWILGLCGLFASFWWVRRPTLGALAVLFLGSDPFQLFEVNGRDNVFGWSISMAVIVLAIHLPYLTKRRLDRDLVFVAPLVTGLLLSTVRTFRSEPVPILAGALLAYVVVRLANVGSRRELWLRRAGLVATLLVTFVIGGKLWDRYFLNKQREAARVVASYGGHPNPGDIRMYHHFWHPIWCGLGDFDKKYGYVWEDTQALAYATPILKQKYNEYVPSTDFFDTRKNLDEYWDAAGYYKKLPYDAEHYGDVVRDKVLHDIKADPGWYLGILAQRVGRVLNEASPVRISWRSGWLDVPLLSAKLFLPVLVLVFLARERLALWLLLFTLPTLTTALMVYCAKGIQWYGVFHLFMAALVVALGIETVKIYVERRRRRSAHAS